MLQEPESVDFTALSGFIHFLKQKETGRILSSSKASSKVRADSYQMLSHACVTYARSSFFIYVLDMPEFFIEGFLCTAFLKILLE